MFSKIQSARLQQLLILTSGSLVVGSLSAILGLALKHLTEHYEDILFNRAGDNKLWLIIFPVTALSLIYILRFYLFKNKENKGLKEVFNSTKTNDELPAYKIPSHFINGFLTVIFGGSTGIEVSTVVATAATGSLAAKKEPLLKKYKSELICAGVAAGITALFNAPLAGMLFAYEVIIKKHRKTFAISTFIGAAVSYGFTYVLHETPLLNLDIKHWHLYALPWFVLLGILAGFQSVYLTRSVIFFKKQFLKFTNPYYKIITGAVIISTCLILLPQLYGEGYHAIKEYVATANTAVFSLYFVITIVGLLLLKPVITAITLSAGGDGGVFAPGLFLGAFLGLFTAVALNAFFDAGVIPLNFMIVGMAAVLSAGIHAPFTALFLICGLTNNYTLAVPLLIAVLVAKYTAARLYPYTVYTYAGK